MATRKIDWINNFWKTLATRPEQLRRTREGVKAVMTTGAIDDLTREMVYMGRIMRCTFPAVRIPG